MGKKPDDPPRKVHDYLSGLVSDLCDLVGKALKRADADAIHDARVTTRRLTAAVRLLEPVLTDDYRKPFAKALKSLRRQLGPLRDLDVMIDHLTAFAAQGRQAAATAWVSEQLELHRKECRDNAANESPARVLAKVGTWLALAEEVRAAQDDLPALLTAAIHRQLADFALEATRLATPPPAQSDVPASPEQDPHELRITGKLLRYSLELAAISGTPLPPACMKQFKRLQESLGLWHDYVVLSEQSLRIALDSGLPSHRPAVFEEVMELARVLWRQAQKHLAQFSQLWLKQGVALMTMIRKALPPAPGAGSGEPTETATDVPSTETDPAADHSPG